tara:strand:- start:57 stop:1058 length:1002 start_codon:yes stop_codon:yes gene_type:complete
MEIKYDWLNEVKEEIEDPDLKICDPHHHLWDFPGNRYLIDELVADLQSGHNVVSTVFMECGVMYNVDAPSGLQPVGETEFANGVAAMAASGAYGSLRACAGIVGFADLCLGEQVGEVLDAHIAASTRFRGIRHAVGWDRSNGIRNSHTNPKESLLLDKKFREGFKELGIRGLSFDAWLYHPQLDELIDIARAFPHTTIILDHFGGPLGIDKYRGRREEIFEVWKHQIEDLSKCPNVVAKLGGLVMPINGFDFHRQASPPDSDAIVRATGAYYRQVIDCFSPDRCMFESNFAVDKQSTSYHVLWNAFKKMTSDFSPDEKYDLFYGTAARVYRLD